MTTDHTKGLNTQPYKGTRDFYPEDKRVQNYIFRIMREVSERFGYEEYDAPLLEETALYRAKSGEEIVNEQTYSFLDRGGRDVTIRPEMTPTLARMVAQKRKELIFPIRWYSIPNLWRYEKPQRGRVREHWQLNVDIYGVSDVTAEFEVLSVVTGIMEGYGANREMFKIRVSNRRLLSSFYENVLKISEDVALRISKIIDRKEKVSEAELKEMLSEHLNEKQVVLLLEFLELRSVSELSRFGETLLASKGAQELVKLFEFSKDSPVAPYLVFDPTIVRGFDYYTGVVFEVFDTNPKNTRSLFGGGRYDKLLSIFGVPDLSGFGFGMGDVTIRDFLEVHKLLPKHDFADQVYMTVFSSKLRQDSYKLAQKLRQEELHVVVELDDIKLDKQLKYAHRRRIPYVLIYGPDEKENEVVLVKDMKQTSQKKVSLSEIARYLKGKLSSLQTVTE